MVNVLAHFIDAVCVQDSDRWFQLIGVQEPSDEMLEKFLDITEKVEELVFEM